MRGTLDARPRLGNGPSGLVNDEVVGQLALQRQSSVRIEQSASVRAAKTASK